MARKAAPYRLANFRTMSDGSYTISLPAGTITRLCAAGSSASLPNGSVTSSLPGSYALSDSVSITAGSIFTPPALAYTQLAIDSGPGLIPGPLVLL